MNLAKKLNRLLPLVAIGTIADCQSVLDPTNQLLVRSGLQLLNSQKHGILGIDWLLEKTGLRVKMTAGYKLTSQDLAFTFSPILNSSGRISHAKESIQLLISDADHHQLASNLIDRNQNRKQMVKDILEEVESQVLKQQTAGDRLIWLEGNWHKGIIGLLASRVVASSNLPVVVIGLPTNSAEMAHGSLRAPKGYNLPQILKSVSKGILVKFGGHLQAAGLTVSPENLKQLREEFTALVGQEKLEKDLYQKIVGLPSSLLSWQEQPNLLYLESSELTQEFFSQILSLDPFGQDFPFPMLGFCLQNYNYTLFSENQHLNIKKGGLTITGFDYQKRMLPDSGEINPTKKTWLQAKISQNSWKSVTSLELIIEQIFVEI